MQVCDAVPIDVFIEGVNAPYRPLREPSGPSINFGTLEVIQIRSRLSLTKLASAAMTSGIGALMQFETLRDPGVHFVRWGRP